MTDHTILQTPPSNLDEGELSDALHVAPPSHRSRVVTRVLSALLLVAVGATGATWWAHRDAGAASTARSPFGTAGALPGGALPGLPGAAPDTGASAPGTTGTGAAAATGTAATNGTSGTVVLVDGAKVYVRTAAGATVTVTTTSATSVSRATPSTVAKIAPGDTVTVTGATTESGVVATAITAS